YRVVEVEVEAYDGRLVRALTLEGQAPSLHAPGRAVAPSTRYVGLLREGARVHGLDPSYISYLDSLAPYSRADWAAAAGRAAAVAIILPLALPLLPPVLLTRMARERATKAAGGGDGAGGGVASTVAAAAAASTQASDLSSRAAAAAGGGVEPSPAEAAVVAAAAASPSFAPVRTASVSGGAVRAVSVPLPVPPELMRPPQVLPAAVAAYMTGIQWTAWWLHDNLAAPLLGSGSSSGGGDERQRGSPKRSPVRERSPAKRSARDASPKRYASPKRGGSPSRDKGARRRSRSRSRDARRRSRSRSRDRRRVSRSRSPAARRDRSSVRAAPDRSAGVGSSHGPGWVWYFAYGSNMNPNTLTGRRQVVPLESQAGLLRHWTLSFRMLGLPYAEPGFATIERAHPAAAGPRDPAAPLTSTSPASTSPTSTTPASTSAAAGSPARWRSEVHGVLHRISSSDWVRVMATEGVGAGKTG
ncbi:hypothetical protein TSOC_009468, partial [Tetrabaena socialis]